MSRLIPRWYVRGPDDTHSYDLSVADAPSGQAFCTTCVVVHERPVGGSWHVEGPEVDTMLCGVRIELDDGEVRVRPAKNICSRCQHRMKEIT